VFERRDVTAVGHTCIQTHTHVRTGYIKKLCVDCNKIEGVTCFMNETVVVN